MCERERERKDEGEEGNKWVGDKSIQIPIYENLLRGTRKNCNESEKKCMPVWRERERERGQKEGD